MVGRIPACLGVSIDPMIQWIFSKYCPLNLLLVRSHQAEIIIAKHLIQGHNNVSIGMLVEARSCYQSFRKNDAFTLLATLPIDISTDIFPPTNRFNIKRFKDWNENCFRFSLKALNMMTRSKHYNLYSKLAQKYVDIVNCSSCYLNYQLVLFKYNY